MKRARWREGFGLPVLLMSALLSTAVTPAAMSAGLVPAIQRGDCASVTPAVAGRAATDAGPGAGFARVTAQLAKKGDLTGRTLAGRAANGVPISVALPTESYVAPADGSVVLFTRSSSVTGSEVRAIDLSSGCDIKLAAPSEIVRSAVLDPSGDQLYVHSVARVGRADAGVTRFDLASGIATIVVPPLRPSDDFGPIFGTELHWSVDGSHLAVESCGFSACLTRVLDATNGLLTTFDGNNQGAFIGLTVDHLLTYGECPGLPCEVVSTDLGTGRASLLATDASSATFAARPDGHALLTIETDAGSREVLQ